MLFFLPGFCDVLSGYEQLQADEPHPHLNGVVLRYIYPQQGRKPLCECLSNLSHPFASPSSAEFSWTSLVSQPVWDSFLNLVFTVRAVKQVIEIKGGQQQAGLMAPLWD